MRSVKTLWSRGSAALFGVIGVCGAPSWAYARASGVQTADCSGCHTGGQVAEIEAHFEPETVEPGGTVALVVKVTSAGMSAAGMSVWGPDNGTFSVSGADPLMATGVWVTQTSPKPATGGEVEFRVDWQAPSVAGLGQFQIAVLGSNGDGRTSGDRAGMQTVNLGVGCEPVTLYWDADGDGFGRTDSPLASCGEQTGYATADGDCDDKLAAVFPGAPELCNELDDDCNDDVDDACGAAPPTPTTLPSVAPPPSATIAPPIASTGLPPVATAPTAEPSAVPSASVTAPTASVEPSGVLPPPSVPSVPTTLPAPSATTPPSASSSTAPVAEAPVDEGFGCTIAHRRGDPSAFVLLWTVLGLLGFRRRRHCP